VAVAVVLVLQFSSYAALSWKFSTNDSLYPTLSFVQRLVGRH
jgi:hypothetical protein